MAAVREIYQYLDGLAPFSLQMEFDNAGSLIGRGERAMLEILVSLDITEEVAEKAAGLGVELIVSHHLVISRLVKSMTDGDPGGQVLLTLAERRTAAICTHASLDAVTGGVGDALTQKLGLVQTEQLRQDGVGGFGYSYSIGRVGSTVGALMYAPTSVAPVKETPGINGVCYVDARCPVRRVAVGGGACVDLLWNVLAPGCDTFVTADVKYNGFLGAKVLGVNLTDTGHYPTGQVIYPILTK